MSSIALVPQSKSNILVVDDKSNNLKLLFQYLQDAEYKVLIAQDGRRALEVAKLVRLDLIILDIMMSGLNGFEICFRLKKNPDTKNIPIIFMTALAEKSSKVKGFELGAVDYITKPFDREDLLARVQTHLAVQHLHQCLANEKIWIEHEFVVDNTVAKLPDKMAIDYVLNNQAQYQNYLQGTIQIVDNTDDRNSNCNAIQTQLVIPIVLKEDTVKANKFYPLWGHS